MVEFNRERCASTYLEYATNLVLHAGASISIVGILTETLLRVLPTAAPWRTFHWPTEHFAQRREESTAGAGTS